jgi:hypothetical protein
MDVGTLRKVLKRYGHWRRLQDHVAMLSEARGRTHRPGAHERGAEAPARDRRQQSCVGARLLRGGPRWEQSPSIAVGRGGAVEAHDVLMV